MNGLLSNVCAALGASVTTDGPECRTHGSEADEPPVAFPTDRAEGAFRLALDRLGAVIGAIPKDQLLADHVLLFQLFELGLKFEVFLGDVRKFDLPAGQGDAKIGDGFGKLDAPGILRNLVKAFEPIRPVGKVIEDGHADPSLARDIFDLILHAGGRPRRSGAQELHNRLWILLYALCGVKETPRPWPAEGGK